jgi:hypothetical protein
MPDVFKPKNVKSRGRELLSGSLHGSFRNDKGNSRSPHREDTISGSMHGLRRSKSSPLALGKNLLSGSLHGAGSYRKDHVRGVSSALLQADENGMSNSYHGEISPKKRQSPLSKGREMLSNSSLHGSVRGKDLLTGSLHGHGRYKTHPLVCRLGTAYSPTTKGCMKVTTLVDSLNSVKRTKKSERQEFLSMLKGVAAEASPNKEHPVDKKTSSSSRKKKYSVRFAVVNVREYQNCISDNPSALDGLPISIDWSFCEIGALKINDFESQKGPKMKEEDLRMNYFDRYEMLRRIGMSSDEIEQAAKHNKKLLKEPKFKSFFKFGSPKRK